MHFLLSQLPQVKRCEKCRSMLNKMLLVCRGGLAMILSCLLSAFSLNAYAQSYDEMRDSLELATQMLNKYPTNIDLRLKKASWNLLLEQWDYALREYDIILANDSDNVAALYYRAFVNEKKHRYKYAKKDYLTMLKLVPGNFNGLLGLALLEQKDMHYTQAMDHINRLIQLYPEHPVAYAARAGMELERGLLEPAEYDYSEAMRLDPDNTDYVINRVDVRIRLGNKAGAKRDLDLLVDKGIPKPSLKELYDKCKE